MPSQLLNFVNAYTTLSIEIIFPNTSNIYRQLPPTSTSYAIASSQDSTSFSHFLPDLSSFPIQYPTIKHILLRKRRIKKPLLPRTPHHRTIPASIILIKRSSPHVQLIHRPQILIPRIIPRYPFLPAPNPFLATTPHSQRRYKRHERLTFRRHVKHPFAMGPFAFARLGDNVITDGFDRSHGGIFRVEA
ncbi:hypothetical protein ABW19_dt0210640 [Dactylella cylindrospora]|nr:hypothetical protein ABW19_dt0210640 [Dactylella cylindrospora]